MSPQVEASLTLIGAYVERLHLDTATPDCPRCGGTYDPPRRRCYGICDGTVRR